MRRTLDGVSRLRWRSSSLRQGTLAVALGLLTACSGGGSSASPGGGGGGGQAGSTPAPLVGAWKYGTASFTNFWGHQGEYIGSGGGTSVRFEFGPDGTYTQQVFIARRNYSCLTETWTESRGTLTFADGALAIHPEAGRYMAADNCIPRNNFDRPMSPQELVDFSKTFLWKFEVNPIDQKEYLMIGFDEQTWSHFAPTN